MALAAPDLEGALAVDVDHDDVAVAWGERAVDDREVPVEQLGEHHAVAGDPHQEGRGPVRDQQALEVDFILDEIVCRAGKPARLPSGGWVPAPAARP